MGKLEENLEKNEYISDEFREIAKQTFQEMLEMLGREDFKKWIKMQTISKDIRSLIYEWADEEEFDKQGKLGDYSPYENKIRIAKGRYTDKRTIMCVAKHENFHFFTRNGDLRFYSTFLNEGVTEYLKHLCKLDEEYYNYTENVEVVTFLRDLIGDSIIQTYLEGKKEYFFYDLHDIFKEDIKSEEQREEIIDDFLNCLDERHSYLHPHSILGNYEFEFEDDEVEDVIQKINDYFEKIILCKFRQMAKSRCFNRNGSFDETLAREIITEKLKNARFVGNEYDFMSKTEIADYITDSLMNQILSEIEKNYNPKAKTRHDCRFLKWFQEQSGEDKYPITKVFQDAFYEKTQLSMIEFTDYISKLAYEFNTPKDKLKELCETYAFKSFEDTRTVEQAYELIVLNIPRNNAVFDLLSKNATSVESTFRKIGDSEYVEQRDGQFVYIKINDDGTIYEESDLSKVKNIFKIKDSLESIKLVNQEDDYSRLGILDEQRLQQVEMVHQLTSQILYGKEIDIEAITNDMNVLIKDPQFLRQIIETSIHKRTRLQVMNWIKVLTQDEIKQVTNDMYDEAILQSGITEIEQDQEIGEYYKNLYDYKRKRDEGR